MPTFKPKTTYKSPKDIFNKHNRTFNLDDLEKNYNVWEIDPEEVPVQSDFDAHLRAEFDAKIRRHYLKRFSNEHPELLYADNENCFSFGSTEGLGPVSSRQTEIGCFCRVGSNYLIYTAMEGHGIAICDVYRLDKKNKSFQLLFSDSTTLPGNRGGHKFYHIFPIAALPGSAHLLTKSGTGLIWPYTILQENLRTPPVKTCVGSPYAELLESEREVLNEAIKEFYSMAYIARNQLATAILNPTLKNTLAADTIYSSFVSKLVPLIPAALLEKGDKTKNMTAILQLLQSKNEELSEYLSKDSASTPFVPQIKGSLAQHQPNLKQQLLSYARFLTVLQLPFPNKLNETFAQYGCTKDNLSIEKYTLNKIVKCIESDTQLSSEFMADFEQIELLDIPLPGGSQSRSIIKYAITSAEGFCADKTSAKEIAYENVRTLLVRGACIDSEFYDDFCSRINKKLKDAGDRIAETSFLSALHELVTKHYTKNLGKLSKQLIFLSQIQTDIQPLLQEHSDESTIHEVNKTLCSLRPTDLWNTITSLNHAQKLKIETDFNRIKWLIKKIEIEDTTSKTSFFNPTKTSSLHHTPKDHKYKKVKVEVEEIEVETPQQKSQSSWSWTPSALLSWSWSSSTSLTSSSSSSSSSSSPSSSSSSPSSSSTPSPYR